MATPQFQIVTVDGETYTQGDTTDAFKALGYDSVTLMDVELDGDWLGLQYEHDLVLCIPEARIKHIVEKDDED